MDEASPIAAAPDRPQSLIATLGRVLGHPLLLLLVGALLSALIVPVFTQRWQDHQRELDVQTGLVSQMTEAATQFMVASRIAMSDKSSVGEPRIRQAWRRWKTDSAVIRAKLRAYYPRDDISREWESFDQAVIGFYVFATGHEYDGLESIESALNVQVPETEQLPWFEANAVIERAQDRLVSRVLRTTPKV